MTRSFLIFNWMDFKNPKAGGQEKYCYEIGRRLAADGYKVIWIASKFKDSLPTEELEGIKIIRTGNIYTIFLFSVLKYFTFRKNSLILISMNSIPFLLPFSRKRRVIMLHHRIDLAVMKEKIKVIGYISFLLQEYINPIFFKGDHIITNSLSSKEDFESIGYKNISIVKLGVEIHESEYVKKRKICISPGPVKPWKHHEFVIRAFVAMPIEWELAITGEFENENYKKKLLSICEEFKISKRVHFLGKLSELELKNIYEQAKICILGTEKEGWGLVAMEAQSFGCPVVAFNVPGIRDSVVNNETGVLVNFGDVSALSDAIVKLASNEEELKTMGEKARKRSLEYDWDLCYIDFKREFEKIANK